MRVFKRALAFILMLALLSFPVWVYFNAQALSDWWQLRGYTPPVAVISLAGQDTLTPYAKHVFYVNHPNIESSASQFRTDCNESEKTIVLGCYHPDQEGIFLYNVQDSRLNGVKEVTAAHEMLHAAYDRLSTKDKNYVDGLLLDYYNHDLHDQRIIDTMNAYKQSEPNDIVNEMHSVFGTEIASLPAPLEKYYTRYFGDRQTVITFANTYQGEFTSRENQIKAISDQLAQLKTQISSEEASLQTQLVAINSDRARLDSMRSSGQTSEYNAGVASFNAEVEAYNAGVDKLKSNIAYYNSLVDQYNALASELAGLEQAIDTRLTPQTAQ
jgi:hypothetical protein